MKKLFLSLVAVAITVTAFSQKIDIHLTGTNVTVSDLSNGDTIQNFYIPVNTLYQIDLSNNSMRWVCPGHNADRIISFKYTIEDNIVTIKYQANGIYMDFIVPVIFKIDLNNQHITWMKLDSDSNEKTVYTFKKFTLTQKSPRS
jgi:hypothetical protein